MNNPVRVTPCDRSVIVTNISQQQCWSIKSSNIPKTWGVTQGEDTIAVVIDTGATTHVDIGDNTIAGPSFIPSDMDPRDYNGHSTHVTGTICAKNNEFGAVGVAPKSTVITLKALGNDGSGSYDSIIAALDYAISIKPDVVCMSLGSSVGHPEMHDKIKKLYKLNVPVIVAAGNNGLENGIQYPALYPETIAVGAFDENGKIADFSSRGPQMDWAAPGVGIYSTYLNNTYIKLNGTSMATPWLCGVVCLLKSKHKKQELETGMNDCRTVEEIRTHLLKYTIDKGMVGKDNNYGYGVIDVEGLINGSQFPVETIETVKRKRSIIYRFLSNIKRIFS